VILCVNIEASWDSSHLDVPSIGDFHEFSVSFVVCCNVKCYVG